MVNEVNKIIYNMLISGRGVFLPEVGSLYIERQGARKISETKLLSPRNVVSFSSHEQAPSLVAEIVAVAKCSEEQAQDIYQRWLSKTRVDGKLTIGGVGSLSGKSFTAEKSFVAAINPKGIKTLVVRKHSNALLYGIVALCVVVALGFLGFMLYGGDVMPKSAPAKAETAPVVQSDSLSANPADSTAVAASGVAGEASAATSTLGSEASAQNLAQGQANAAPTASAAAPQSYTYYVVMGIFSTEENANRAVEQANSKIDDLSTAILPFKGGRYMVTLFGSDKSSECNEFARSYKDIYPDLWVYKVK